MEDEGEECPESELFAFTWKIEIYEILLPNTHQSQILCYL